LKFIASGIITIEMVQKAKGRVPTLPKQVNKSAKNLSNSRFDEVVDLTVKCLKTTHHITDDTDVIEIDEEEEDVQANIIDISSGSESDDCK